MAGEISQLRTNITDWFIATEDVKVVKVVKDSASLWPQIITAVSPIGAVLSGVCLTHHVYIRSEERVMLRI
ncbi:hypothetical protein [Klebsiella michiganensis]|uniref:hypothetical protein n=1 Tax=Klebsiella michiganensis TaxID=1134687 RepID=UPI001C848D14|nr:hypothetical protein [Klebsiella michiganensis]